MSIPAYSNKPPCEHESLDRLIRATTSKNVLGQKVRLKSGKTKPIYLNRKDTARKIYRALRAGRKSESHFTVLTQKMLERHLRCKETYYYSGAENKRQRFSLVTIDIDCHRGESMEEARRLAKFLSSLFPNLYWCESDRGVHCFFFIEKSLWDISWIHIDELNRTLKDLQRSLKLLKKCFGVGAVEIKGSFTRWIWGDERYDLQNVTYGSLAKLPRLKEGEFELLRNSTVLNVVDLKRVSERIESFASLLPQIERSDLPDEELASTPSARLRNFRAEIGGSQSGCIFSEQDIDALSVGGAYWQMGFELLGANKKVFSARRLIRAEDLAIAIMILRRFTNSMNLDGSMPMYRVERMWGKLYDDGEIDRAFNYEVWGEIRELLWESGFCSVEDSTYIPPKKVDGEKVKGKAMRWQLSIQVMDFLNEVLPDAEDMEVAPNREKRDSWMTHTSICLFVQKALQTAPKVLLKPRMVADRLQTAEEVTDYIHKCRSKTVDLVA